METNKSATAAQRELASAVGQVLESMMAAGVPETDARQAITDLIADQIAGDERTHQLSRLRASIEIEHLAEQLQHEAAYSANAAGAPWAVIGGVAGMTAQAAWKRWKNPPSGSGQEEDLSAAAAAALDGWHNATAMGRILGVDPRTVRAMGERGELEVIPRRSTAGRSRDLFRERPGS